MNDRGEDQRANEPVLLATYQVIAQRRLGYDQMAWQTPALSFTALAFLFAIALGSNQSEAARLLSALLALVVSLLSIQLLRKHHHMELIDSLILERLEERLGVATAIGLESQPHTPAAARATGLTVEGEPLRSGPLVRRHSPGFWTAGLALFALGSVGVIVITLAAPSLLP